MSVRGTVVRLDGKRFSGELKHSVDGFTVLTGKRGRPPFVAHAEVKDLNWSRTYSGATGLLPKRPAALKAYAQDAAEYAELIAEGVRNPVQYMASVHGRSQDYQGRRIWIARSAGFLTPTKPTVAGGELTDKAREILAD